MRHERGFVRVFGHSCNSAARCSCKLTRSPLPICICFFFFLLRMSHVEYIIASVVYLSHWIVSYFPKKIFCGTTYSGLTLSSSKERATVYCVFLWLGISRYIVVIASPCHFELTMEEAAPACSAVTVSVEFNMCCWTAPDAWRQDVCNRNIVYIFHSSGLRQQNYRGRILPSQLGCFGCLNFPNVRFRLYVKTFEYDVKAETKHRVVCIGSEKIYWSFVDTEDQRLAHGACIFVVLMRHQHSYC